MSTELVEKLAGLPSTAPDPSRSDALHKEWARFRKQVLDMGDTIPTSTNSGRGLAVAFMFAAFTGRPFYDDLSEGDKDSLRLLMGDMVAKQNAILAPVRPPSLAVNIHQRLTQI